MNIRSYVERWRALSPDERRAQERALMDDLARSIHEANRVTSAPELRDALSLIDRDGRLKLPSRPSDLAGPEHCVECEPCRN
ncbi:MAG: hypothetical protein AB7P40_20820 [Chloroflexota bacterium]